jgi:hypothetical protein
LLHLDWPDCAFRTIVRERHREIHREAKDHVFGRVNRRMSRRAWARSCGDRGCRWGIVNLGGGLATGMIGDRLRGGSRGLGWWVPVRRRTRGSGFVCHERRRVLDVDRASGGGAA